MKTDVYTVVLVALYLAIQWYLDSFTLIYPYILFSKCCCISMAYVQMQLGEL